MACFDSEMAVDSFEVPWASTLAAGPSDAWVETAESLAGF
jgi:hypothetical protein